MTDKTGREKLNKAGYGEAYSDAERAARELAAEIREQADWCKRPDMVEAMSNGALTCKNGQFVPKGKPQGR